MNIFRQLVEASKSITASIQRIKHDFERASMEAPHASRLAHIKTHFANKASISSTDPKEIAYAHKEAANSHRTAAELNRKAGYKGLAAEHEHLAGLHTMAMKNVGELKEDIIKYYNNIILEDVSFFQKEEAELYEIFGWFSGNKHKKSMELANKASDEIKNAEATHKDPIFFKKTRNKRTFDKFSKSHEKAMKLHGNAIEEFGKHLESQGRKATPEEAKAILKHVKKYDFHKKMSNKYSDIMMDKNKKEIPKLPDKKPDTGQKEYPKTDIEKHKKIYLNHEKALHKLKTTIERENREPTEKEKDKISYYHYRMKHHGKMVDPLHRLSHDTPFHSYKTEEKMLEHIISKKYSKANKNFQTIMSEKFIVAMEEKYSLLQDISETKKEDNNFIKEVTHDLSVLKKYKKLVDDTKSRYAINKSTEHLHSTSPADHMEAAEAHRIAASKYNQGDTARNIHAGLRFSHLEKAEDLRQNKNESFMSENNENEEDGREGPDMPYKDPAGEEKKKQTPHDIANAASEEAEDHSDSASSTAEHKRGIELHTHAMKLHKNLGNDTQAKEHEDMIGFHKKEIKRNKELGESIEKSFSDMAMRFSGKHLDSTNKNDHNHAINLHHSALVHLLDNDPSNKPDIDKHKKYIKYHLEKSHSTIREAKDEEHGNKFSAITDKANSASENAEKIAKKHHKYDAYKEPAKELADAHYNAYKAHDNASNTYFEHINSHNDLSEVPEHYKKQMKLHDDARVYHHKKHKLFDKIATSKHTPSLNKKKNITEGISPVSSLAMKADMATRQAKYTPTKSNHQKAHDLHKEVVSKYQEIHSENPSNFSLVDKEMMRKHGEKANIHKNEFEKLSGTLRPKEEPENREDKISKERYQRQKEKQGEKVKGRISEEKNEPPYIPDDVSPNSDKKTDNYTRVFNDLLKKFKVKSPTELHGAVAKAFRVSLDRLTSKSPNQ